MVMSLGNQIVFRLLQVAASLISVDATALPSSPTASSTALTPACAGPPGVVRLDHPLLRVAEQISADQPLTIVAIGSSSTFGAGASAQAMSYPSRLALELRALLPRARITVINRGVNGETAQEMLARFDADVFAASPDLVLWQVGSNSVLLGSPITPALINDGLRRLKLAGPDVILINPQYAPKVLAKHEGHDVESMVSLISAAAREVNVDVFERFSLMRYWRVTEGLPFSAFLSQDELHMNDWSYGCMAHLLALAIAEAASRGIVRRE